MSTTGARWGKSASGLACTLLLLSTATLAGDLSLATPETVSPGGTARILTAAGSCPTFSWAAPVEGGIELVVSASNCGNRPIVGVRLRRPGNQIIVQVLCGGDSGKP